MKKVSYFKISDFPLKVIRMPMQIEMEMHWHEFEELVIITDGEGVHCYEDEEYRITAGDIFLIPAEASHSYRNTKNLKLTNILFVKERLGLPDWDLRDLPGYHALFHLEPQQDPSGRVRHRLHVSVERLNWIVNILTSMEKELQRKAPGYRHLCCGYLMEVITFICRRYEELPTRPEEPMLAVANVLSYLETNFRKQINMNKLAQIAHMSQSSIQRHFLRYVGRSPIKQLLHIRIQHAARYLRETDSRISEVSKEAGFIDSNYFTRQFSKTMGKSPRQYRKHFQV